MCSINPFFFLVCLHFIRLSCALIFCPVLRLFLCKSFIRAAFSAHVPALSSARRPAIWTDSSWIDPFGIYFICIIYNLLPLLLNCRIKVLSHRATRMTPFSLVLPNHASFTCVCVCMCVRVRVCVRRNDKQNAKI